MSAPTDTTATPFTPVTAGDKGSRSERYQSLDIIRGFALLGLPLMNIVTFAMPMSAYLNPMSWDTDNSLNLPLFAFSYLFFDQKFLGLFALLFGAGAALLCDNLRARQGSANGIYFRRQFWLLLMGLCHAWFLWNGDILFLYALLSLPLFFLLSLSGGALLMIAVAALGLGVWFGLQPGVSPEAMGPKAWRDLGAMFAPDTAQLNAFADYYLGDYSKVMAFQRSGSWDGSDMAVGAESVLIAFFMSVSLKAFAMMCIGVALLRLGLLQGTACAGTYRRLALFGLLGGLVLSSYGFIWNQSQDWQMQTFFSFGHLPNMLGSVLMSLGYLGLLLLWLKSDSARLLQTALANVGKMALTNYLYQSLIMALLFFGYGLGWYGQLGREGLVMVALIIGLFQAGLSSLWLRFFIQGPMEWLWRALTWWTLPPLLRR